MNYLFEITGKVQHGKNRGKNLGFPTINLSVDKHTPEGIYISHTIINGKVFNSISFVGAAIHFGEKEIRLETYLLDFNQNVYGDELKVGMIKKIRENEKFSSDKELIEAMEQDKRIAEEYFEQTKSKPERQ